MGLFTETAFDHHEFVHHVDDVQTGLRAIIAVHNSALGPGLGGLRMYDYASDDDALADVLRLSKGMTYKNALAGIPFGGGKAVIIGDPKSDKSSDMMRAFGRAIHRLGGNYITAEDVGTSVADMDDIRSQTPYARGTTKGSGNPSPFTARGVRQAIHAGVRSKFATQNISGLHIAIQGLGNVGYGLAEMLHADGAGLTVTDMDVSRCDRARHELNANIVEPDQIYDVPCDVFAPCAMGASINDATILRLKTAIVCGAANNQLAKADLGAALEARGILYIPDFVANAGGVINIALEGCAPPEEITTRVDAIRDTVDQILEQASDGRLPVDVAETLALDRIRRNAADTLAA